MTNAATYAILFGAVVAEVVATSALKSSESFSKLGPSLLVVAGYSTAFWLLSITLNKIPTGVAYAIWSGLGVVLIAAVGRVLHGQKLDVAAMLGLSLILSGVLVINLFSKTVAH